MSNRNSYKTPKIESIEVEETMVDPQSNFYSDTDQKIKNHSFEVNLPDVMMDSKKADDIPAKFFRRVSHPMPYQGVIFDRDPKRGFFRQAWINARNVGEDQR